MPSCSFELDEPATEEVERRVLSARAEVERQRRTAAAIVVRVFIHFSWSEGEAHRAPCDRSVGFPETTDTWKGVSTRQSAPRGAFCACSRTCGARAISSARVSLAFITHPECR